MVIEKSGPLKEGDDHGMLIPFACGCYIEQGFYATDAEWHCCELHGGALDILGAAKRALDLIDAGQVKQAVATLEAVVYRDGGARPEIERRAEMRRAEDRSVADELEELYNRHEVLLGLLRRLHDKITTR